MDKASPCYMNVKCICRCITPTGCLTSVLRIRILRIHMFLGLLDPDLLVSGMDPDPDPSIMKQK